MNNAVIAAELVKMAKELEAVGFDQDERPEFLGVANGIESLRGRFSPASDPAIFLGIIRDMAVHLRRGNTDAIHRLSQELVSEFGR
jgi:hypothetical protein